MFNKNKLWKFSLNKTTTTNNIVFNLCRISFVVYPFYETKKLSKTLFKFVNKEGPFYFFFIWLVQSLQNFKFLYLILLVNKKKTLLQICQQRKSFSVFHFFFKWLPLTDKSLLNFSTCCLYFLENKTKHFLKFVNKEGLFLLWLSLTV